MKVVGLYRELIVGNNRSLESIRSVINQLSSEQSEIIVRYLKAGIPVFDVMEASIDPFDSRTRISGGPSLVSDGHWVWRRDLAHFVEKYRIGLPPDFIEHTNVSRKFDTDTSRLITDKWEDALKSYENAERWVD
ncbi:hypothetical protein [Undibacterium sp.]|uniref:hypothetical protein n=1 Tax=Undibacterium sp. TaxID=1914977 RepID=UPI00374D1F3D